MRRIERRVLALSRTLQDRKMEVEPYKRVCQVGFEDWDCNCHFADTFSISECVGDWQVFRRYAVEMEYHNGSIIKDAETGEVLEDDVTNSHWYDDALACGELDDNGYEEDEYYGYGYENRRVVEAYYYWDECTVAGEIAQLWWNVKTNDVVFLGRVDKKDSYYADYDEKFSVIPVDESKRNLMQKLFYNRFFAWEGDCNYMDISVHPLLLKYGYQPLSTIDWKSALTYHNDLCEKLAEKFRAGLWYESTMKRLLNDNQFEKDWKIGGPILALLVDDFDNPDDLRTAYKIRRRNPNFVLHDMDEEEKWYDIVQWLSHNGRDCHNAHYVCPDDIGAVYRNIHGRVRVHDNYLKELIKQQKKEYEGNKKVYEREYYADKKDYLKIAFEVNGIKFHVLQSVKEFLQEGLSMSHCVFRCGYYKKKNSVVLSSTIDDKRVETIELDLRTGKVIQSYGAHNIYTALHSTIVKAVEDNADKFTAIYKTA